MHPHSPVKTLNFPDGWRRPDNAVPDPYQDFAAFIESVATCPPEWPPQVAAALAAFARAERGGALLVRNFPLPDAIPPTPTRPFRHGGARAVGSERLFAAVVLGFGSPFSYEQWEAGLLIHNKYPIREHATVQFGSNAVEFMMHTETPYRAHSPDVVALLCLRGDPAEEAITWVVDLDAVFATLPNEAKARLRRAEFAFRSDHPVVEVDGVGYTRPHPIIFNRGGRTVYEYTQDVHAVTPEGRAALALAREAVSTAAEPVRLRTGDLLLMDNAHIAHGRSSYRPAYDGSDRWLQRMLVCSRLSRAELAARDYLVKDECLTGYSTSYREVLESLN